jgi:hypothetical protein
MCNNPEERSSQGTSLQEFITLNSCGRLTEAWAYANHILFFGHRKRNYLGEDKFQDNQ